MTDVCGTAGAHTATGIRHVPRPDASLVHKRRVHGERGQTVRTSEVVYPRDQCALCTVRRWRRRSAHDPRLHLRTSREGCCKANDGRDDKELLEPCCTQGGASP